MSHSLLTMKRGNQQSLTTFTIQSVITATLHPWRKKNGFYREKKNHCFKFHKKRDISEKIIPRGDFKTKRAFFFVCLFTEGRGLKRYYNQGRVGDFFQSIAQDKNRQSLPLKHFLGFKIFSVWVYVSWKKKNFPTCWWIFYKCVHRSFNFLSNVVLIFVCTANKPFTGAFVLGFFVRFFVSCY